MDVTLSCGSGTRPSLVHTLLNPPLLKVSPRAFRFSSACAMHAEDICLVHLAYPIFLGEIPDTDGDGFPSFAFEVGFFDFGDASFCCSPPSLWAKGLDASMQHSKTVGVRAAVMGGRPVSLGPDPQSYPLCRKCLAICVNALLYEGLGDCFDSWAISRPLLDPFPEVFEI